MEEPNYTKREHDAFRAENKQQHETVMAFLAEIKREATLNNKVVGDLCKVVSDNSGAITVLQAQNEANSKATKIINEISTTWKWTRWVVSTVIGFMLFLISVKSIIYGGVKEGLEAIKDIIL